MRFNRADYSDDLGRLRSDRRSATRAIGDNFGFEENVGPERVADFEAFAPINPGLRGAAADYFWTSVQGSERTHTPSTFQPVNGKALLDAGIERTQKIVRIERIDEPLDKLYRLESVNFDRLRDAVDSRDSTIVAPFIRTLNEFPGARPAFACFKAEVAVEAREDDWFPRLRARLGLGHWALAAGEVGHFALMEYMVEEIFRQTSLAQPFAVPTVLEDRNSEFFFPAPNGIGAGYSVDLDHNGTRDPVRQVLHIRLTYSMDHLKKVVQFTGPTATVGLAATRDAHLLRLRTRCGRADYGEPMTGAVDD